MLQISITKSEKIWEKYTIYIKTYKKISVNLIE